MPCLVAVDVVDDGGQRGGFTGTGGAGNQHQAGPHVGEFLDHRWNAQLFQRSDFCGNETEDGAQSMLLLKVVAAEAGSFVHFIGKVQIAFFQIFLECLRVADFREQGLECLAFQIFIRDGGNGAVDTDFWGLAFAEVKVGASGFYEIFEVLVDNSHNRNVSKLKRLLDAQEGFHDGFVFRAEETVVCGDEPRLVKGPE